MIWCIGREEVPISMHWILKKDSQFAYTRIVHGFAHDLYKHTHTHDIKSSFVSFVSARKAVYFVRYTYIPIVFAIRMRFPFFNECWCRVSWTVLLYSRYQFFWKQLWVWQESDIRRADFFSQINLFLVVFFISNKQPSLRKINWMA